MKQIFVDNIGTNYYITEDGRCFNSKTGKCLKGQTNCRTGYITFNLTLPSGLMKRCAAHRLVAEAFIPNPLGKPEVNHKDGNKANNCVDNLEWCTSHENKVHAVETGLRATKHVYCFSKDKKLVAEYKSIAEAEKAAKVSYSRIIQEVSKPVKALTNGFYWSYEPVLGETVTYKNLGKAKPVNQYTRDGKFIMTYPSTGIAAAAINGNNSHIGECCRGKIKSYKGFVWRYVEDIVSPSSES